MQKTLKKRSHLISALNDIVVHFLYLIFFFKTTYQTEVTKCFFQFMQQQYVQSICSIELSVWKIGLNEKSIINSNTVTKGSYCYVIISCIICTSKMKIITTGLMLSPLSKDREQGLYNSTPFSLGTFYNSRTT